MLLDEGIACSKGVSTRKQSASQSHAGLFSRQIRFQGAKGNIGAVKTFELPAMDPGRQNIFEKRLQIHLNSRKRLRCRNSELPRTDLINRSSKRTAAQRPTALLQYRKINLFFIVLCKQTDIRNNADAEA